MNLFRFNFDNGSKAALDLHLNDIEYATEKLVFRCKLQIGSETFVPPLSIGVLRFRKLKELSLNFGSYDIALVFTPVDLLGNHCLCLNIKIDKDLPSVYTVIYGGNGDGQRISFEQSKEGDQAFFEWVNSVLRIYDHGDQDQC